MAMFVCIDVDIMNSNYIMVEATAVNTIDLTCLDSCHSSSGDVLFDRDNAGVTANFDPFYIKDISSSIRSFLERFITHLSWVLEEVEVTAVLSL